MSEDKCLYCGGFTASCVHCALTDAEQRAETAEARLKALQEAVEPMEDEKNWDYYDALFLGGSKKSIPHKYVAEALRHSRGGQDE